MAGTPEPVEFVASLPPILSAIRMGQDSWRVQFDIPHSDIGNAAGLLAYFGTSFRVRVTPDPSLTGFDGSEHGETRGGAQIHKRTARKPLDVASGGL